MSFTKVAPAGIGTEPGNSILIGDSLLHSTGIDIGSNTGIGVTIRKHGDATFTGIVTAASFSGDGAGLSNTGSSLSEPSTGTHRIVTTSLTSGTMTSSGTDSVLNFNYGTHTLSATNLNVSGSISAASATITGNLGVGGVLTYEDVTNIDSIGIVTARLGINLVGNDLNVGSNIKIGNASGIISATSYHGDGSALTGINTAFGNSSVNSSGIATFSAFVPTAQGSLSHRNLIINGAMRVAQRGTSSTSTGYQTVDRFQFLTNTVDEAPTQAQVDVASGTTPYTLGFRKALKITNGNQTSVGAADAIYVRYRPEAQDIAGSGWNYTSTSSFITLSFWVKSSVAQNFFGVIETSDGTQKMFPFQTGSLSADTWTKVTITIPGHADLAFNFDNGQGLGINWVQFMGTDYTANSAVVDTWKAQSDTERMPDNTSTWYTTNDATFEITGVQLEVGSVATPFEHRSFIEEELRCQRYYWKYQDGSIYGGAYGGTGMCHYSLPVRMRIEGTLTYAAIRTTTGFYNYSSDQLLMVQMSSTIPYITFPELNAEL